jgi:hypothetical protein
MVSAGNKVILAAVYQLLLEKRCPATAKALAKEVSLSNKSLSAAEVKSVWRNLQGQSIPKTKVPSSSSESESDSESESESDSSESESSSEKSTDESANESSNESSVSTLPMS